MNAPNFENNMLLNFPISFQEVQYMVKRLKRNKATGIDNIPYEMLMNNDVIKVLFNMYSKCFSNGTVPSIWLKAIITPIPKSNDKDPYIPTNYRGISLLSCICKGYTNVLNNRLSTYYETKNLLVDEQNGFRSKRACIDHIFSITSIIRNRLKNNVSTFVCFIDFQKAFDYVNRDLLLYKLLLDKVDGNMYFAIKSIYDNTVSSLRLNNKLTDWFDIDSGVRQGDALSTTLFSTFINDLAIEINSLNLGIDVGSMKITTLLYADDIILVANDENDLQRIIDHVYEWCQKWRMTVNIDKTNIVHFRKKVCSLTKFDFHLGSAELKKVDKYKYLGVILDEFLNFDSNAEVLSAAASRALGAVINKFKCFKNAGYNTYYKLFHTNVCPILDYCSGVWGYKIFTSCDKIQNRAARWYLGVHSKTTLFALSGDMGWVDSKFRRHVNILRFWNRITNLDNNRLVKKVFLWDKSLCSKNWSEDVKNILGSINMLDKFYAESPIDLKAAEIILKNNLSIQWKTDILTKPKLRTYIEFKDCFETDNYVKFCKNRLQRSLIAQLRFSILPLNIEIGRFRQIALEDRLCTVCDGNVIEDEFHFICQCPLYNSCRLDMYQDIINKYSNFSNLPDKEKFIYLMKWEWKLLGKFLGRALEIRTNTLYINGYV
jgi:hypothetical protein